MFSNNTLREEWGENQFMIVQVRWNSTREGFKELYTEVYVTLSMNGTSVRD
jgi:hypothetical protein